ncbi:energy transducer TonB [Yokenella regensburgei]
MLVLPFIIPVDQTSPDATPATVMVTFSPEFEMSFVRTDLQPGVTQQRKVEAMTEEETAHDKAVPRLLVQEEADIRVAAAKQEHQPKKKTEIKKISRRQQREEQGNSTANSLAAPPVQTVQTQRNAAPLDTDSSLITSSKVNWESLVKGKINKMRSYPMEARRRNRSGTAVVMFNVNEQGDILSTQLVTPSGTLSLDKAALNAVENARPLPPPPKMILRNGVHKVTMPVEFELSKTL